jgi:DNA-damage-inducible protein J
VTTIQIPIEEDVKAEADGLFSSLGIDTQTAVRMFLFASIANSGIPFAIRRPVPNDALLEAIEDAEKKRNLHGPFDTVEEAMASMLADDE